MIWMTKVFNFSSKIGIKFKVLALEKLYQLQKIGYIQIHICGLELSISDTLSYNSSVVKLFIKESVIPAHSNKALFLLAPVLLYEKKRVDERIDKRWDPVIGKKQQILLVFESFLRGCKINNLVTSSIIYNATNLCIFCFSD